MADFISREEDDICLDISDNPRHGITESAARELILKEFGTLSPVIRKGNREETNQSICRLAKKEISIRQLSRLSGISKSIIESALK